MESEKQNSSMSSLKFKLRDALSTLFKSAIPYGKTKKQKNKKQNKQKTNKKTNKQKKKAAIPVI